jgi:hypothetical protein
VFFLLGDCFAARAMTAQWVLNVRVTTLAHQRRAAMIAVSNALSTTS